jgi:carboxypeptidase family protein
MVRSACRLTWRLSVIAMLLALPFVAPRVAAAQGSGGLITGTVADAQGGVLPGVSVTVRNADSGVSRSTVTEPDGKYRLAGLPPGRYELRVELSGFAAVDVKDIALTMGLEIGRNVTLQLEGVQESLTVTGQSPVVETTKTDVSAVITQQQIESLPIASRQPVALALLMPGTSQDGTRPRKFNANMGAGAFTNAGAFLIDGVWNKEPCTGEPRQNYPQVAIREFKVNVSQASAEFGWTASGVVTVATKSGTNRMSGEAFEYFRDKSLNTMNKFEQLAHDTNGAPKPAYRRNQFGGAMGGPIIEDRLHFFLAAERTKEDKFITVNTGKPQFYSALEGVFPIPEYDNTFFGRVDMQIDQQQNFFVRAGLEGADYTCDACGGTSAAFSNDGIKQPRTAWAGGHTWVLSSKALNEVRFQWSFYGYYPHPPGVDPTAVMYEYPTARTESWTQTYIFPTFRWGTASSLYVEQFAREIRDDFSLTTSTGGRHTWKFGGGVKDLPTDDDVPPAPGSWSFSTDQQFDGTAATIAALRTPQLFTAATPAIERHLPNRYWEAYVQDEWRPASTVTLNLGLRYEYQAKVLNQDLNISDLSMFPTTGTSRQIPFVDFAPRGDKNNFGPRLGLAWDLKGNGNSVVRAAYGIYYNPIFTSVMRGEQTNFRQAAISISNPTYPDPYGGKDPLTFASTAPQNISIADNALENAQSMATTVGLSQALSSTLAIHVDGVYTHMTKVPLTININPRSGGTTGTRPLPAFARIDQVQSRGELKYEALLVRLEKRLAQRFLYLVSYTLAKGTGDVTFTGPSGSVTVAEHPEWDWGPAANDRRHVLVASGAVLLPGDVTLGAVWTLRSTMPFSAVAGRDLNGDGSITDYVPGTTRAQGNRDLDLSLVNAWRGSIGLAPIAASQIDSNRYNSLDVRANKAFSLGATRKVELIGQVFNVMGTENLQASGGAGGWTTNATSDSFGRILTALSGRQAELAVRIAF